MLVQIGAASAICGACGHGGPLDVVFTVETPCGDQVGVFCVGCGAQFATYPGRTVRWVRPEPVPQELHAGVHAAAAGAKES